MAFPETETIYRSSALKLLKGVLILLVVAGGIFLLDLLIYNVWDHLLEVKLFYVLVVLLAFLNIVMAIVVPFVIYRLFVSSRFVLIFNTKGCTYTENMASRKNILWSEVQEISYGKQFSNKCIFFDLKKKNEADEDPPESKTVIVSVYNASLETIFTNAENYFNHYRAKHS
jgi:hypothetical protein